MPAPEQGQQASYTEVKKPTAFDIAYMFSVPLIGRLGNQQQDSPIPSLDVEKEQGLLCKTLNNSNRALKVCMAVATSVNFRDMLTQGTRAIHYTGHGLAHCLAFENGAGRMHDMAQDKLSELFQAGKGSEAVEFVFVSSCHSEPTGQMFVKAGVPHVIAVKAEEMVADTSSQLFMTTFYQAVLAGHTVQQAFDTAKASISANAHIRRSDEPKKFLLLPPNGDHDVQIFEDVPKGEWKDHSVSEKPENLNVTPHRFLGRNKIMCQVYQYFKIQKSRLVTLTGAEGIGKTTLATAIARYMWKRGEFDGVFFVEVNEMSADREGLPKMTFARLMSSIGSLCKDCDVKRFDSDAEFIEKLKKKNYLLVFDGADSLQAETNRSPRSLRKLLKNLLNKCKNIKVLVTCETMVSGVEPFVEKAVPLGALAPADAAQLFYNTCPRQLSPAEYNCNPGENARTKLAQSDVLKHLSGHPRRIYEAAQKLTADVVFKDLLEIVVEAEKEKKKNQEAAQKQKDLLFEATGSYPLSGDNSVLPPPAYDEQLDVNSVRKKSQPQDNAWENKAMTIDLSNAHTGDAVWKACIALCNSRGLTGQYDQLPWESVEQILAQHFDLRANALTRSLSSMDLSTLRQDLCGHTASVSVQKFLSWWKWFDAFEGVIYRLPDIWSIQQPASAIFGHCSKGAAASFLSGKPPGTFLLRFSGSNPSCIAVAFVDQDGISIGHVLIHCPGGQYTIILKNANMSYPTLPEVIMKCGRFVYLYPDIPKEQVFSGDEDMPH